MAEDFKLQPQAVVIKDGKAVVYERGSDKAPKTAVKTAEKAAEKAKDAA